MFGRGHPKQEVEITRGGLDSIPNGMTTKVSDWYRTPKRASEVYTETPAMRIAAYYRAISILSGTVASLPLNHEKKTDGVFRVTEGELQYLLTQKPNDNFTAFEMIRQIICRTMNTGNAYVFPRQVMGEVYEFVLLNKGTCQFIQDKNLYYVSDVLNGIQGTFFPFEIIHIKNIAIDGGYTGLSTIQYAARCLGIAAAGDEQSLDTFDGGTMMKGFVAGGETMRGIGAEQEEALTTIGDRIEGELRSGKNIISLPEGTDFRALQMTVAEAKLLEHREFTVFEISRFTGVPPEKLFVNMPQNYKASEMSQINFLNDSINPFITQIEQEFSAKIIGRGLAFKERIKFDRDALLNTDITAKADFYQKMHGLGVLTTNEIRAFQGLLPLEGGDQPLISTNLQKLNEIKVNNTEDDT